MVCQGGIDFILFPVYIKGMDPIKARLIEEGGRVIGSFLRLVVSRPRKSGVETEEEPAVPSTPAVTSQPLAPILLSTVPLPTSAETIIELKRRLGRELYKAELDLAAGLLIAGKPCTCLESKHTLELEAAAEELISEDPNNTVYLDIIQWINTNQPKVTIEAIYSGKYADEYPRMSNEFKNFRKRVMGTVAIVDSPGANITLEQAKNLAASEAAKEVERQWHSLEKK